MSVELQTKLLPRDGGGSGDPVVLERPPARRLVGRYELLQRLGHGGMATVYLGRATGKAGFEKLVAVKVIHPHLGQEPEFVEMFLDEARIAARLHHPHVVEILDLGEDAGEFYMVMEYVEGSTLSSLLRCLRREDAYLSVPSMMRIVADACEGLAAAHELRDPDGQPYRLVHRDVSPQNLLVSLDGWVKVMDFGIMKAAGKRSNTLTGQLRGKLAYMAPEQAQSRQLDRRTDLFALGAVLWEMCTNRRLFAADTDAKTIEKVTRCEVPSVLELRPDLPPEIDHILRRALARDPDDRYATAEEMLEDARSVLRQSSVTVHPRRVLGQTMRAHFSGRVDYARAARAVVEGTAAPADTVSVAHPGTNGRVAELATTPVPTSEMETPSAGVPVQQESTLTTSIATAPARYWTLWLLLPLLGAAIGTLLVTRGGTNDEPDPAREGISAVVETSAATGFGNGEPAMIKWVFNTEPQHAVVLIDGEPQPGHTPLEVVLPASEESVRVRIEKDGYHPREISLAPVASGNHMIPALQPIDAPIPAPTGEGSPGAGATIRPRLSARPPKSRPATAGEAKRPKPFTPAPDASKPARGPKKAPDFKALEAGQGSAAED